MIKITIAISFFLLFGLTSAKCQEIYQLGYFNVNGISAMSSATNYMMLGNGNIIDISNPSTPVLTGNMSLSGFSTSVLVDGNYSYYGTGMSVKLIIADISNPAFPILVGSKLFPQLSGGIFGLTKSNNILYLAMGDAGIYSVDVTDKANPIVLDSLVIPNGQSRGIAISGNIAYVAHYDGLKIVDVSDSSNMNIVTTIGLGYESVEINNNLVFAGKTSGGIDVFDITNPLNPVSAFSVPNASGTAWDLKIKNNLIYLSTNDSGLFIYKYNNTAALEMAHFLNAGNGQSFAVCLQDSLIFLSGLINGVAILLYDSLGITGIKEPANKFQQPTIFNNPSKYFIEFENNNKTISNVEIINSLGQLIQKNQTNCNYCQIDISSLPNAIYIICFENNSRKWYQRFMKVD